MVIPFLRILYYRGLCISTPRGDGNKDQGRTLVVEWRVRFMHLNPARGRKPSPYGHTILRMVVIGLCISTPRGDGNSMNLKSIPSKDLPVYAAQPREGTKVTSVPSRGMEQPSTCTPTTTPLHAQALSPPLTPSTYPVFLWGAYGKI